LKKRNAEFGGEPSGSWIFPEISLCPDGILAAARLVEIVEKEGRLDALMDELPTYPMIRGAVPCSNEKKKNAMDKITIALKKLGDVTDIDGIRVDTDNGWILVRPSGTEPKIRITVEARKGVEGLYSNAEKLVRESF